MTTKDFAVHIGQDEIGQILNLKENLDHHGQLSDHLARYQIQGWELSIVTAQGADLGLDLRLDQELWWRRLVELGMNGVLPNLVVRTGEPSRLLVLEVGKGEGALSLDLIGDWRACCVAELGQEREQHYYALPPEIKAPPCHFLAPGVLVYGEAGLVLAPPSIEPATQESWRWLTPPWESPPQPPTPALWQYLREQLAPAATKARPAPHWREIYRIIAPYDPVLKALLAPPTSMENYYGDILQAGLVAGLRDWQAFLGLLWHAPHGDARHNAERWQNLQELLGNELLEPGESPPPPVTWDAGDAWPDWGPLPELPARSGHLPDPLDLTLGEGKLRQLLGDLEIEPCLSNFTKLVSGQFVQLLAALGEKMMTKGYRHQADVEQGLTPFTPAPGYPVDRNLEELPWVAAMEPHGLMSGEHPKIQTTVRTFLSKNPDLAYDRNKVQMVLFSLKNYVSINPEYAGMSFQDKLELAGQMARSFLELQAW